jgi:FG-GAP repeat
MRIPGLLWTFPLLAALSARPAAADIVCVEPGGAGGCHTTLAGGLAAATPGDVVRVAAGTYTENVLIDKNVTLEGGWDAAFTMRDPGTFTSTIVPADATQSVVDIEGDIADPGSSTPVFDGFTVSGGMGDLGGSHGGGLRLRDTNATVSHSVVSGNRAYLFGGGIWVQRGAPRLEANRIEGNVATGGASLGGGVNLEGTQALLVDDEIVGNTAETGNGGGLAVVGGGPVAVRGGRIEDNSAGAACDGDGGGLDAEGVSALEVDAVRFQGNCADAAQGGVVSFAATPITVANSLFVLDQPAAVGILSNDVAATTEIRNCSFVGPGTAVEPAGVAVRAADPAGKTVRLTNDLFFDVYVGAQILVVPAVFSHNDFFGNQLDYAVDVLTADPAELHVDPLLDAGFHLTAASPLVDAGARTDGPFHDVDGEARPMDGGSGRFRFDIGADELSGPAQRVLELGRDDADLTIVGPGNPPENPDSNGNNDWIGYSVLARDVSGDGADDLVVAAEDWAEDFDTVNATGRLFGFRHFGARRTGVIQLASEPPDFQVVSLLPYQHVGEALAAGDLDGDGALDLLVGSSQNDMQGDPVPTAFAFFGGASLASAGATIDTGALGDFAVTAPEKGALQFAAENGLAAGDLSGDGIDDLAVGDALADDGALAETGAVFVVFGQPGLAGVLPLETTAADFTLYGPQANSGTFGVGPYEGGLALGDLDGDGQLDLVARDADSAHVIFGPLGPGSRHLSSQPADLTVTGLDPGGVLVMDATGDGVEDLLLDSGGDVRVIPGPLAPGPNLDASAAAAFTLLGADPRALAQGDLLGDRRPELLLGDPAARRVRVVSPGDYGPGDVDVDEVAAEVVTGSFEAARNLGFSVAAGDLDGDGRDDLVAGAWQLNDPSVTDPKAQDVGKAFVFYGDPLLPPCPPDPNPLCIAARKGRLSIDERKPGKEKLSLRLSKLAAPVGPAELGDPVSGGARYDLCLYDDADTLLADLALDRAGQLCGRKPCWKAAGGGFRYADPSASAGGVKKLVAKGGAAGKGKLSASARNAAAKGQAALPTGLAAALAGRTSARVQAVAGGGACFELRTSMVKRADGARFVAAAP